VAPVDEVRTAWEKEAVAVLDGIYRLALWLGAKEADARDLVQETYVRALEARETFHEGRSVRAWLARILRNLYIDRRRREGREVSSAVGSGEATAPDAADETDAPLFGDAELGMISSLVRGDIAQALDALPENHRIVVLLCDVEQWGWEETAAALQCPIGTVKSRLFRARRALRDLLADYAPVEAKVEPVR
jgi:RNA polymerase sigma-70 factor, ECF subfamily